MKKTLALFGCMLPLLVLAACGAPNPARNDDGKSSASKTETVMASIRTDADEGNVTAQYELGSDFRNGWGVPQDWAQAYFWLSLAAAANQRVSDNAYIGRNEAALHLKPDQIAALDSKIAAWKPRPAPVKTDADAKKPAPAAGAAP